MSEGFVPLYRSEWDDPLFKPSPMSEREAWLWIVSRAGYAPTQHRVGSLLIDVPVGAFVTTLREMQHKMLWSSDKRVRGFLDLLQRNGRIGRTVVGAKNAPKTLISICNYERFTLSGRTGGAPGTQVETHRGRTGDAVKNKGTREQHRDTVVSLRESSPDFTATDLAFDAFNGVAERVGWSVVQKRSPSRRSALKARLKEVGGSEGWVQVLDRAARAPHLIGQNNRNWMLTFDWLVKPANLTKIMEGNYDPKPDHRTGYSQADARGGEVAIAARARRTPKPNWG